MLEPLIEAIETVKKRIDQHRQPLSENETRTRGALIDPILKALGWDPGDPALVTLEYSVGKLRADYALLKADGKPAAVLEAKRLGAALADHLDQMIGYAFRQGIKYAGLINGDQWELYEIHKPNPINENRIIAASIVEDEPHACALELLTLWRLNLASGNVKKASTPITIINKEETSQPTDPEPAPDSPEPEPTPIPEPPQADGWTPLSEFNVPRNAPPPSTIRFPEGKEIHIHSWTDIQSEIARWLYAQGSLTSDKMPVRSETGKRFIANSEPKTRNGKRMLRADEIADGIYVSRHGSAEDKLKDSVSLLQHCNVDPSEVLLKRGDFDEGNEG